MKEKGSKFALGFLKTRLNNTIGKRLDRWFDELIDRGIDVVKGIKPQDKVARDPMLDQLVEALTASPFNYTLKKAEAMAQLAVAEARVRRQEKLEQLLMLALQRQREITNDGQLIEAPIGAGVAIKYGDKGPQYED